MTSISNLVLLVTKLDAAKTAHLQRESNFDKYAANRRLPADLTRRVKSYFDYQWQLLGGVDEQKVSSSRQMLPFALIHVSSVSYFLNN